ncbi:MAG: thiamine pyrophosphate-dependent enzyme [Saprospiraceae bacterium]
MKNQTLPSAVTYDRAELLRDYYLCCLSREISKIIRKDVLTGRAKFGVSDDGKELYQIAMAKSVQPGDWRADYYRGHTFLLALDLCTPEDLLAQLYADTENDPFSAGRQMNNHHATPTVNERGEWLDLLEDVNLSSDISTTGGQMARGLGLAFASKKYRAAQNDRLAAGHSDNGNEVCHLCIGDGSTSEGPFWEAMNAAGVLQVPLAVSVADDGYGISVPVSDQTVKGSISEALAGMQATEEAAGIDIVAVNGWDYPALRSAYQTGIKICRRRHRPVLFHVTELTQPQGHSTSGSHERYKSRERLAWEREYDCNRQFRHWLLATDHSDAEELTAVEKRAAADAKEARKRAWDNFRKPLLKCRAELQQIIAEFPNLNGTPSGLDALVKELNADAAPARSLCISTARRLRLLLGDADCPAALQRFIDRQTTELTARQSTHLYSQTPRSPLRVLACAPVYEPAAPHLPAHEILNRYFDAQLTARPDLFAFGEDVGRIGDVNQGFAGMQDKHGAERVFDSGIREWTIIGQGIGMAMRGLRPIAEIQYLDYLIYALSPLSDDLATLRWRTAGKQAAPLIVRSRGHRLEGVWHSGSPMGVLLGSLRGIHICVPRDAVRAVGLYNTLLAGDDPGLVIEVLNGYRQKERLPTNLIDLRVPLGEVEVIRPGTDITVLTYGACVRICREAADLLAAKNISVELIDAQTLLPFDRAAATVAGLRRTGRLLIVDEDVPGGGSGYLLHQVLQVQNGYRFLDAPPRCLTAAAHRTAYGDDGNYAAKPQVEDVVEAVLNLLQG